jgi:hypothetical protein
LLIGAGALCLEAAEPDDPDDPEDIFFGPPARLHQDRSKAARKEWRRLGRQWLSRAEKLGAKDPQVLEQLMDLWFSHHPPQAMEYMKRLLVLTPDNFSLHVKHALMLALEGRFPQAESALQHADGLARRRQDPAAAAQIREVRQSIEDMQKSLQMTDYLDDLDFPDFPDFPDLPDRPFGKGFRPRGRK